MSATAVSLINMKGGVGKTTLAFNLAWHAAYKRDLKVLCIDLDPQSNLSQYMMTARNYLPYIRDNKPTIVDIFEQFSAPTASKSSPHGVDLDECIVNIRAWPDGSQIDLVPSRLELAWTLKNPTSKDHLLAKFLSNYYDVYDLILIDCAPTESILTQAAYRSSRFLLIPVKPEFLASIGLPLLVRSLREFQASFGQHDLSLAGVAFSDSDPQHRKPEQLAGREDVLALAKQQKWYVFQKEVRHSESFPTGARNGKPIFMTKNARWWVIDSFDAFAQEFVQRVKI